MRRENVCFARTEARCIKYTWAEAAQKNSRSQQVVAEIKGRFLEKVEFQIMVMNEYFGK